MSGKLHHMGFRGSVTRTTLADANERHDWRIYSDFAQFLISIARPLYAGATLPPGSATTTHPPSQTLTSRLIKYPQNPNHKPTPSFSPAKPTTSPRKFRPPNICHGKTMSYDIASDPPSTGAPHSQARQKIRPPGRRSHSGTVVRTS